MARTIIPAALNFLFQIRSTFALIDVREPGEYNTAHIPGSSLLPRRLLEFRMERLVPCRFVQLIVCDDDGRRAALSARTIEAAGYTNVAILEGGLNAWASEGFRTEWGMNVPSKDFGERVEVTSQVPTIEPIELKSRQDAGESIVILDTRTPEEYRRANIPGGWSMPGGELALRVHDVVRERPGTTVVVNCAGRTRSIIGARTLQRMGIRNVLSLRNGTSGWTLAGLQLEHGADRFELLPPSDGARSAAEEYGLRVAAEDGVHLLDPDDLDGFIKTTDEATTYFVDVRTEEEFLAGHIPGFWWFPGGQAVQRADDVVAVANGRIVFCCDAIARSAVTASWFCQMGYPNVYALRGGTAAWAASGRSLQPGAAGIEPLGYAEAREAPFLTPEDLHQLLRGNDELPIIFIDPSDAFAEGHIAGSHWLPRGWMECEVESVAPDRARPVVVTDLDGTSAWFATATLHSLGYHRASTLEGGTRAWRAAGLPLERGLTGVMRAPNDIVAAGTDRSYADMVHYLSWEEALGQKYISD
jgi:rhodanese-related sulfurtransferase